MVERYISPLAKETHRRLWSKLDDGNEAGILTRILDDVDDWRVAPNGSKYNKRFHRIHLVSAAFLHASLRAPNSVYHELYGQWDYAIPALMIGSKFRRDHMIITNEKAEQPFVDCALYYPANAGTTQLGMTAGSVDANGKGGCHRDDMKKICFKNNSCSELYNIDCSCDSSKVPPHMMGDHFAELFSNLAKDSSFGNFFSRIVCSYPGTEQGLKDMIAASNSLWKQRHGWCRFDEQECETSELKYRGHTECMASKNIMNVEMADGIIIQMPPRIFERQVNLERLHPNFYETMLKRLQELYDWGYTELPIVFMEELKGMSPEACRQHWGGEDCQVGYRKEVYTQAFNFSNGACIASPPGCNEVYYFPPDKHTGTCVPILQNKTCLAENDIMLPAQDQDSLQVVESGVSPRILLMTQMSGIGYLLTVVWLAVLLYVKKIHRSGGRGRWYTQSHG
jgi:hypothetical protein